MFIVGDEFDRNYKFPWVTCFLIGINILVFAFQTAVGNNFTYGFSLVPMEISTGRDLTTPQSARLKVPVRETTSRGLTRVRHVEATVAIPQARGPFPIYLTLFTFMFLHCNGWHLIGNLWFLAIFGRKVEHALDHGGYLAVYVTCGIVSGLAHVLSGPDSVIPCMGASGAIAGILAAHVVWFPWNKVKLWIPPFLHLFDVPALVIVGVWFLFQYAAAVATFEAGTAGGVAYWAHVGGFVAGLLISWAIVLYPSGPAGEKQEEEAERPLDPAVEQPLHWQAAEHRPTSADAAPRSAARSAV